MSREEIAIRAWAQPHGFETPTDRGKHSNELPPYALVFDAETTIDPTQRLLLASCRILCLDDPDYPRGSCLLEVLVHADDLPRRDPQGYAVLERYAAEHEADLDVLSYRRRLRLLSRREFMRVFYRWAYKKQALVVGFNLVFDLARLAVDVGDARRSFGGGFSLVLWDYETADGTRREHSFRPRLIIKSLNSKQHLFHFTERNEPDPEDYETKGTVR
jgi:hypothetical protein